MHSNGKKILICDCEGSMRLDSKALAGSLEGNEPFLNTQLCRSQVENFRKAAKNGDPLIVCCTQEAPLFDEIAQDVAPDTPIAYVNIRERAGWSDEGKQATAKTAALIAEAALDLEPATTVSLKSEGAAIIYGAGDVAIDAAKRLASRLDVRCILKPGSETAPSGLADISVSSGTIIQASGRLGAFELTVTGLSAAAPSSRRTMDFSAPQAEETTETCDILIDLSGGTALFPAPDRREGYFRADPASDAAIERALFQAADMVGEFEKPRYALFKKEICAHSRNEKTGCTRCLSACPTSAIRPDGDHVFIDPYICVGHGACASVCPTGAIAYNMPAGSGIYDRMRVLLKTYREAGGETPVLLVHDTQYGNDLISMMARHGRGLPANVLPFAVNEVTHVGIDFLLAALSYGAARVHIVAAPKLRDELEGLIEACGLLDPIMGGLGYGENRATVEICEDPDRLQETLYKDSHPHEGPGPAKAADFKIMGGKRSALSVTLKHLHAVAPAPVDTIALAQGAPFGAIEINAEGCTLCLSCVTVCPAGAIGDNPDKPQLKFLEANCVQCGLCRGTCPENVITLTPRLNFTAAAGAWQVVKEEEPFECIRCGKPYGSKSTIEHMIGKLAGHPMFSGQNRTELLKMCDDCRVKAQFEHTDDPFAAKDRPLPRTTDDYLRERDSD